MKARVLTKIFKSKTANKIIKAVVSNAPKILAGISVASSIAAVGFAIKGTVVAVKIEKERKAKIESGELPVPKHPKWETVKAVYPCYIPSAMFLGISVGSGLYGLSISEARTALATGAYEASKLALEEFKSKTTEEIGAEKVQQIEQSIAKDNAEQYGTQPTTLVVSPYDEYLCMEKYSGQIIRSDISEIRDVYNQINYTLSRGQDMLSLSEYCNYFGIDCPNECIGWNITKTGLLMLRYDLVTNKNGAPMIMFYPSLDPNENYDYYG